MAIGYYSRFSPFFPPSIYVNQTPNVQTIDCNLFRGQRDCFGNLLLPPIRHKEKSFFCTSGANRFCFCDHLLQLLHRIYIDMVCSLHSFMECIICRFHLQTMYSRRNCSSDDCVQGTLISSHLRTTKTILRHPLSKQAS